MLMLMSPLTFPTTMINALTIAAPQQETSIYLFSLAPLIFISLVIKLPRSAARSHLRLLITPHSRWHNPSAFIHSRMCANANILRSRSFFRGFVTFSGWIFARDASQHQLRSNFGPRLQVDSLNGDGMWGRRVLEVHLTHKSRRSANQPSPLPALTLARFPIKPGYNLLLKVMFVSQHVTHWISPKSHTLNPAAVIVGVATQYTQVDLFKAQASTFWICFGCKRSKMDDVEGDIAIFLLSQPNTQHSLVEGVLMIGIHKEKRGNLSVPGIDWSLDSSSYMNNYKAL